MKLLNHIFALAPETAEDWAKLQPDEKKKIIAGITQDLNELFKQIKYEFQAEYGKQGTVDSDEYIGVLTAILPASYKTLQQKMAVIGSDTPNSEEAAFTYTTLFRSLGNKERIERGESPSSGALKAQLRLQEDSSSSSSTPSPSKKELSTQLKSLVAIEKIADKLLKSTLEAKLERIIIDMNIFDNFITAAPSFIKKYPLYDQSLEDIQKEMHKIFKTTMEGFHTDPTEENYNEHVSNILDFQRVYTKLMLGLFEALKSRIEATAKILTPSAHKQLIDQIDRLNHYLPSLLLSHDTKIVYQELVDKFAQELTSLVEQIDSLPQSREEVLHRFKAAHSEKEAENQFPKAEYPFLLSPTELRKSENTFLQDQIALSQRYSELPDNDDKFILSGKLKDNLFQIEKDGGRNLLIQGQDVKALKGDALRLHLETTFGQEDALNLIKHYDQGLSLMISGAVSGGTSTANLMDQAVMLKQAENFTQNIFSIDGIVYRDAALKYLNIVVQDDEETPNWIFKVNLKALSWTTKDGFTLQYMGTDSPLICAALMQKSNYENLEKIVKLVLKFENEFKSIKDDSSESMQQNQLVNVATILATIAEFKTGKITFDQLAGAVYAFSDQATQIINARNKLVSLFKAIKKDSNDILPKLLDFNKEISSLKDEMDKKVIPHEASIVRQDSVSKLVL